ncbi:glutathione peroxidase [Croceifilum oryzae]|uniref:Glutathione peroxidase n=1 Tax=Croceifilum oryzae TaxID=1553429 RepID=A0AAJ1TGM7_9BACL|nr:glutathione peroxidase [Croceifilum oryzae]MDQ0418518.1 glutathione peroxidase [Croceifilum oryzae]
MDFYQLSVVLSNGQEKSFEDYRGKAVLLVNTASKCGFTSQYKGLQELYETYHSQGLEVIGFPCNQFMGQEPGSNEEIQEFCEINYGVKFPITDKIEVNGSGAHPVFQYLCQEASGILGGAIKWNFTKFLVDRSGNVVKRFAPTTKPEECKSEIEKVLK